jgi:hypothetical protein
VGVKANAKKDPGLGDFEDTLILKTFGDVPDDFECAGR